MCMKHKSRKNKPKQNTEKLNEKILHRINELEQEKLILVELNHYLEDERLPIDGFVNTIHDMTLNPMVPIITYVDMLLAGHFGDLTMKQKEKLQVIKDNTMLLKDRITRIKSDKNNLSDVLKVSNKS